MEKCSNIIVNNNEVIQIIYKDRMKDLVDLDTYKQVYNELINETNENKVLIEELEKSKKIY